MTFRSDEVAVRMPRWMVLHCFHCRAIHSRTNVVQRGKTPGAVASEAVQQARVDGWHVSGRVELVAICPRCLAAGRTPPRVKSMTMDEMRRRAGALKPFWDSEIEIGSVPRRRRGEETRVRKVSKGGSEYVDVRVFYEGDDGKTKPGRGITLPIDTAGDVADLIRRAVT